MMPCPTCKGRGWDVYGTVECPDCKGTGGTLTVGEILDIADPNHPTGFWRKQRAMKLLAERENAIARRAREEAVRGVESLPTHAHSEVPFVFLDKSKVLEVLKGRDTDAPPTPTPDEVARTPRADLSDEQDFPA